jgi:8-oxo-dGTP pyrophosphatase MutT (NUDIX family)
MSDPSTRPQRTRYPEPGEDVRITRSLVAATCIVTDAGGRVLMHRRADNGLWGLPGGAVEEGESVAEAAVREVFEETGVRVRVLGAIGIDSGIDRRQVVHYPDGNVVRYVSVTVACEAVDASCNAPADPVGGGETEAVGWFELGLDGAGGLRGVPGGAESVPPPHRLTLEAWLADRASGRVLGPVPLR